MAKLKRQAGKDIYIFGSAAFSDTLTDHRLIDEARLALVPVLLGQGNLLFKNSSRATMKLLQAKQLENGCVILCYEPQGNDAGGAPLS